MQYICHNGQYEVLCDWRLKHDRLHRENKDSRNTDTRNEEKMHFAIDVERLWFFVETKESYTIGLRIVHWSDLFSGIFSFLTKKKLNERFCPWTNEQWNKSICCESTTMRLMVCSFTIGRAMCNEPNGLQNTNNYLLFW